MKFTIRKKFTFEAAHQLESAFSNECWECIHGHSYTVELILESNVLDDNCMVVDFKCLKPFIESVKDKWDHGLLLHVNKAPHYKPLIQKGLLEESKVSFLNLNPTAEIMASIIYWDLTEFLKAYSGVFVSEVRIHETGTGWASVKASKREESNDE